LKKSGPSFTTNGGGLAGDCGSLRVSLRDGVG